MSDCCCPPVEDDPGWKIVLANKRYRYLCALGLRFAGALPFQFRCGGGGLRAS